MADLRTPVEVPGTRIVWTGLHGWIDEILRVNRGACRPSAWNFRREAAMFASLTRTHVLACEDVEELDRFERFMRIPPHESTNWFDPLRGLSRTQRGEWITLANGRKKQVLAGSESREKGPRLDPSRLPEDRLQALIQSHRDMGVVEALRAELSLRRG